MQYITVTGRLGRDAKKQLSNKSGEEFISLTLASDKKVKGESKVTWFDVVLHVTTKHEKMLPYLKKGSAVIVGGDYDDSIFDGNNGPMIKRTVLATYIEFNGGSNNGTDKTKEQDDAASSRPSAKKEETPPADIPMTNSEPTPTESADDTDDLPF